MDRNIDNNVDNNIIQTEYSELMQKSYIDYAMSVIIARALPDVRDGLKPVQRRTLYDMHELGIRYDKPYRKSARIVGDTMGKYHPHGDSSIYDAMVVLAQDFKKGMPLIDGHGNFGSIEGDGAAAMRYTEARLQKITQEAYLADLDKNVVDFIPNYDETEKEPEVLPVKVPNLLINGAEGIAVGMATSIPPHNFGEVVDGVIAYMKNPDITTAEMMQYIKGPDFPTGGIVANQDDLAAIYETGQGKIKIRGRIEIEKGKAGKDKLVITEIPYTMIGANIGKFLNDVYSLDGSTDETPEILNQEANLHIITHPVNQGKGVALKHGLSFAKKQGFRYAITIDSDGQHFASDIPVLIEAIEKEPDTLLVGSRNLASDNMPGKNTFANKFSNFWFTLETGIKLQDTQSGYRLYPIQRMNVDKWYYTAKYEFELEALVFTAWGGNPVKNIPVHVYYPPVRLPPSRRFHCR